MQELIADLKDAARYLLQNGQTKQGLAVQACVTLLEDDSDDDATPAASTPGVPGPDLRGVNPVSLTPPQKELQRQQLTDGVALPDSATVSPSPPAADHTALLRPELQALDNLFDWS